VQVRAPKVGGGYRLIVEPWRVIDVLESFEPTSVEVNDKTTLLPVTRWARRNDVGSVLFSHERLDDMLGRRTGYETTAKVSIKLLNRILVRNFDAIVVTSAFAHREFRIPAATVGCPILRVPLGVDLETFQPAESVPSSSFLREGEALRLVHFGRLSREKSPHLAVATAVELHRRGVPISLDVYGEGPHLDELVEIAGSAPVTFHGHVAGRAELARRVAAADIALSVCPGETFGLAVLEALAAGTPVVTASVGGASELIDAGCGAWGDPDPHSLADAVLELAGRDEASTRAAARRRAEQFPWSSTVEKMIDIHAALAGSDVVASA
jgi:alpha-1,6-mannosyltransferase